MSVSKESRLQERAEKLRWKELDRQLKEMAKLNELEQARLQVAAYENEVEVLLSVHKQASDPMDWKSQAFALPPHAPAFSSRNHLRVFLNSAFVNHQKENFEQPLQQAWSIDQAAYQQACGRYEQDYAEWSRLKSLAQRILDGDILAYSEAVTEFSAFGEIANLGASLDFKPHDSKRVRCVLSVNGQDIIPAEMKTLTSSGKLSSKPMPKVRFHEIYQDYVCGCCLRIGRELLSLLPVDTVLVTITLSSLDSSTGQTIELPVLSALLDRLTMDSLNFDLLDPSDAMEKFNCRGDVKISRKSGEFTRAIPHVFEDSEPQSDGTQGFDKILRLVTSRRAAFQRILKRQPAPEATPLLVPEPLTA